MRAVDGALRLCAGDERWCKGSDFIGVGALHDARERLVVHILRAVALGARGTLIGRAFLYGLGAGGRAGVTRVLEILHKELDLTMALCGRSNLSEVDDSILLK